MTPKGRLRFRLATATASLRRRQCLTSPSPPSCSRSELGWRPRRTPRTLRQALPGPRALQQGARSRGRQMERALSWGATPAAQTPGSPPPRECAVPGGSPRVGSGRRAELAGGDRDSGARWRWMEWDWPPRLGTRCRPTRCSQDWGLGRRRWPGAPRPLFSGDVLFENAGPGCVARRWLSLGGGGRRRQSRVPAPCGQRS